MAAEGAGPAAVLWRLGDGAEEKYQDFFAGDGDGVVEIWTGEVGEEVGDETEVA